jgi:hypothetical protein
MTDREMLIELLAAKVYEAMGHTTPWWMVPPSVRRVYRFIVANAKMPDHIYGDEG